MSYSIFEGTMADMNYQEIEQAAKDDAIALFPVSVIEEHGPHLCLGTDTYLSYNVCKKVKMKLQESGFNVIIAPPFYWGINHMSGSFSGSFTVRRNTMIAILVDILLCLKNWGFNKIFLYNLHGDYYHNMAILDAVRESRIDYGVRAYAIVGDYWMKRFCLNGEEDYVLINKYPHHDEVPKINVPQAEKTEYIDIHAGSAETSLMLYNFPKLVDVEKSTQLKSTQITWNDIKEIRKGWNDARSIAPLGYFGDPSKHNLALAQENENRDIMSISKAILEFLGV